LKKINYSKSASGEEKEKKKERKGNKENYRINV
jgi:hypothetical protein